MTPTPGTNALPNNVVGSTFGPDSSVMGERRRQDAYSAIFTVGRASMSKYHPQGEAAFDELVCEAEAAAAAAAVAAAREGVV
jgi:alkyl hydroperoxide reductase subunit AhpF